MVPKGWEFKNLEDLEGSDRPVVKAGPFGSSLKKEFYTETGYKIYGQEQVIADDAFYGDYYIDEKRYHSLKSCAVEPDDILISLVGTIGKVLLVPENAQPGVINPRLLRISLNKKQMSSKFFKYFLESRPTVNLLDRWAQGGTMGVLNAATLKALKVPVPPLLEQQKIAKILSTWDKAIGTTERLIENSTQQKKALMQQLLTGKKRLLDDEDKRFAGEWKETALIDTADSKKYSFTGGPFGSDLKSSDYSTTGVRIIQLQNIGDGCFNNDYKIYTTEEKADHLISCNIYPDEIIISKMGDPVARATLIPDFHSRYLMASDGIRLSINKSKYNNKFILEMINSTAFRGMALSKSTGSTRRRIGLTDLRHITFNCPTLPEQQKIATVLTNADKEIELLEQQLADLQQEKKALMQVLLTGKKRVVVDGALV